MTITGISAFTDATVKSRKNNNNNKTKKQGLLEHTLTSVSEIGQAHISYPAF